MFTSIILKSMWSEGGYATITPLNYQDVMLTPKFPGFVLSASLITHIVVIFNSFYLFMLRTASVSYKELSKLEMPHAVTPIPAIQHQLNDLPPYHRPLHTLKCLQSRLINTFITEKGLVLFLLLTQPICESACLRYSRKQSNFSINRKVGGSIPTSYSLHDRAEYCSSRTLLNPVGLKLFRHRKSTSAFTAFYQTHVSSRAVRFLPSHDNPPTKLQAKKLLSSDM